MLVLELDVSLRRCEVALRSVVIETLEAPRKAETAVIRCTDLRQARVNLKLRHCNA